MSPEKELLAELLRTKELSSSPVRCSRKGTPLAYRQYTKGLFPEEPGAAMLVVEKECLHAYGALYCANPHNNAVEDNDRTWTTGDVFELFFQPYGQSDYYEAHTTPEGIRLQLHIADYVTIRQASFDDEKCDFSLQVKNAFDREKKIWYPELIIPFAGFGGLREDQIANARFAFARYSYLRGMENTPEITTTRVFPKGTAHYPPNWHILD